MAKVADSSNYQENELTVNLDHSSGGKTIVFHDSVITLNEGAFNRTQRVYVSNERLAPNGNFTLSVRNNRTGMVYRAFSEGLDSVRAGLHPFVPPYYPIDPHLKPNVNTHIDYSVPGAQYALRYKTNEAIIYQPMMRMHFYDSLPNTDVNYWYVDYNFDNQYAADRLLSGDYAGALVVFFNGQQVYSAVGKLLPGLNLKSGILGRRLYKVQFFVYSSTQDYSDYLEFEKPALYPSPDKPHYSNFENREAYGIFTFRTRCMVTKEVSKFFMNEFAYNEKTCAYQFYTGNLLLPGCILH